MPEMRFEVEKMGASVRSSPATTVPAVVVGGGQAGLSTSYCLKEAGIEHLVFEKSRIGSSWRTQRWDTFCLVTPNWQCQLPGYPYAGPEPEGFMKNDDIIRYLEGYAASFQPPVLEDVQVLSVERDEVDRAFLVSTSVGLFRADSVVVATGGYHVPRIPELAKRLPPDVVQLHSADYRNPHSLPAGEVLVVGTGQSGCQIAEDLHLAGRTVHLCVGPAPRCARRYRGKDVVEWLHEMGHYDMPIDQHPSKEQARDKTNHYVTGRDGGRDIDLRRFATEGMRLYGRLNDVTGTVLRFGSDLKQNLDQADAVAESIKTTIDNYIAANGIKAPMEPRYQPVWQPEKIVTELDYVVADIRTIIWSMGYHSDYRWIELPIFDGKGYPGHQRGVTGVPGIYFLGLPWQYTWGSGRFSGVADDARFLAECIEARHGVRHGGVRVMNELALGS